MESFKGSTIRFVGVPGSGKTTLCITLCKFFNKNGISAKYFPERISIDLLNLYLDPNQLNNRKKYAYDLQVDIIKKRNEDFEEAYTYSRKGPYISLIDGSVFCDQAFETFNYEEGYITEEQHKEYQSIIYSSSLSFSSSSRDPIVFLDCSTETAIRRLRNRGNEREIHSYNEEFYNKINKLLHFFLPSSIITIPYNKDTSLLDEEIISSILLYIN